MENYQQNGYPGAAPQPGNPYGAAGPNPYGQPDPGQQGFAYGQAPQQNVPPQGQQGFAYGQAQGQTPPPQQNFAYGQAQGQTPPPQQNFAYGQAPQQAYPPQGQQGFAYGQQPTGAYPPVSGPAPQPKKKKTGLIIGLVVGGVVLAAAAVALILILTGPSGKYEKAQELFLNRQYEEAYEAFSALGNYDDSADMTKRCRYEQAKALLESKSYDRAFDLFAELGDYGESKRLRSECVYRKAGDVLEKGDYETAYKAYLMLGDYNNASDKADELAVTWAEAVIDGTADGETFANTVALDGENDTDVYNLVIDEINENIDASIDDWRSLYAESLYWVVTPVPDETAHAAALKQIFGWMRGDAHNSTFYSLNRDAVNELLDTDWIYYLLEDSSAILSFLEGKWYTSDRGKHFDVTAHTDDNGFTSSYNLPFVEEPEGADYFDILEYVYWYEDENDTPLVKVFEFEIIDAEEIEVYCYQDGETYTLYRD